MNVSCATGHLGDQLWIGIMLSKIPEHHVFAMPKEYHPQMIELFEGLDIEVIDVEGMPEECATNDCWIANGRTGLRYDDPIDILGFVRRYMNAHCSLAGIAPVFDKPEDFLCSFPSIKNNWIMPGGHILAVNCDPLSGQCPQYSRNEFDEILEKLAMRHKVICTNPTSKAPCGNFSLAEIGSISTNAKLIIGIASGPLPVTFNIFNKETPRHIFLDPMKLDYGRPLECHANAASMVQALKLEGWL